MAHNDTYSESLDALASHDLKSDQWILADALLKEVGVGESHVKFEEIRTLAKARGMDKVRSVASLRVLRDTAAAWPPDTRIVGVGFTAHRAANGVANREEILRTLVTQYGAHKVTVTRVNDELVARSLSSRTTIVSGSGSPSGVTGLNPTSLHDMTLPQLMRHIIGRLRGDATMDDMVHQVGKASDLVSNAEIQGIKSFLDSVLTWRKEEEQLKRQYSQESVSESKPTIKPSTPAPTTPEQEDTGTADVKKPRQLGDLQGL